MARGPGGRAAVAHLPDRPARRARRTASRRPARAARGPPPARDRPHGGPGRARPRGHPRAERRSRRPPRGGDPRRAGRPAAPRPRAARVARHRLPGARARPPPGLLARGSGAARRGGRGGGPRRARRAVPADAGPDRRRGRGGRQRGAAPRSRCRAERRGALRRRALPLRRQPCGRRAQDPPEPHMGPARAARRDRGAAARHVPAGRRSATGYSTNGASRRRFSLGKGVNALFAGPSGTGKTMAAEIIAQRARARPLQDRSLRRRQQVHRRDGEEPRSDLPRRREQQRDPLLRRGGRALRQALRGPRLARPLREHRDRVPAPADGAVRGRRDPRDQPAPEHGRGVRPPPAVRRRVPVPRRGAAGAHLAAPVPGRRPSATPTSTSGCWRASSGSPAAASRTSCSAPPSSPPASGRRSAHGTCCAPLRREYQKMGKVLTAAELEPFEELVAA